MRKMLTGREVALGNDGTGLMEVTILAFNQDKSFKFSRLQYWYTLIYRFCGARDDKSHSD